MPLPSLFSADFKPEPYWWEDAPPPADGETALPARADVAVIGSGYTGLHAALQTARAGRDTVVLEAEAAGHGCSSRNGGQVSIGYRPTHAELRRDFGRELADRVHGESFDAFDYLGDFIEREEIDCAWRRVGRFHGAHLPSSYEALAREIENEPKEHPVEAYMVPRAEQRNEIGSDIYHGGVVYPQHASLHPGLYHLGLLAKSGSRGRAGGDAVPGRGGGAGRGRVPASHRPRSASRARRGGGDQRLHRPLEPLAPPARDPDRQLRDRDRADRRQPDAGALPEGPGGERQPQGGLLLPGEPRPDADPVRRPGRAPGDRPHRERAPPARGDAPGLPRAGRNSHIPFLGRLRRLHLRQHAPHRGSQDGVHYAMGYCGTGLSLASYCGMRVGQKVLGGKEGDTALDNLPFKTRPCTVATRGSSVPRSFSTRSGTGSDSEVAYHPRKCVPDEAGEWPLL